MFASLAELCGIETSFKDARGETQHASPESIQKILAAMGVEARTEGQATAVLAELRAEDWTQALPPVRVCDRTRGAPDVEITLGPRHGRITWILFQERGETARGSVAIEQLRLLGRRMINGEAVERRALTLSPSTPPGYHRFSLESPEASMSLIVSPGRCYLPPAVARGQRWWGIAAQLYAVRSRNNWGIGDFSDLRELLRIARDRGGDVVGVNPLHALFLDQPSRASPYSPLSRLLLNVLNIDVTKVPEFEHSDKARDLVATPEFSKRQEACRASEKIDYESVTQLKRPVLRHLYETFQQRSDQARITAFDAFRRSQPEAFRQACVLQALRDLGCEGYEHAGAPGIEEFLRNESVRIDELVWYQWIADEQLASAATEARSMALGIYRDLAVGSDASGAERWTNPAGFAGAHIGAPPDLYNPAGQDWGLPAPHPRSMRAQSYTPFIELLRANMRHAGALRIDHAMALQHLFWIPEGATPEEGAYVKYPMEELIGILALESQRNRCVIVGEDLGTVPVGFRERMAQADILSYRVLYFEKDDKSGDFLGAGAYPRSALAVAASHDLPSLAAWWQGADIALKQRIGRFGSKEEVGEAHAERDKERNLLARTVGLSDGVSAAVDDVIRAVHAFLAGTPSLVAMAQLDDITCESEPVNVPGTSDEYPNWRRRYSVELEGLSAGSLLESIADRMNEGRKK